MVAIVSTGESALGPASSRHDPVNGRNDGPLNQQPPSSSSNKVGIVVAVVISVLVVCIMVAFAAKFFVSRSRKRTQAQDLQRREQVQVGELNQSIAATGR